MKIASWNVNSLKVRLPQVLAWLEEAQPDVLGIQETKLTDENFPRRAFEDAGWHVVFSGQKTYNGVALVARTQPTEVIRDIPGLDDPQRRILGATVNGVRIYNLYVPNGSEVGSEKYAYKLDWLEKMTAHLADERTRHERLAVVGDFNITPADTDVHDPEALAGEIHCSEPERAALQRLCGVGLTDTFRLFEQPERAFSWWDYRMNAFRRNLGLRIDLVLASDMLRDACESCVIDVAPRRNERPSDHAPVIAAFAA
ncbi:exodeoxyribonuclease III [Halofilum ochraceum]|uniref:exodeoxyribonuclease III n=1 Tax=Halofilum ochraceum TaxID=1611323 RepID=UPI0008DA52EA|nr:exodeoxyribonuclease III [Halofilum ochraceum]